METPLAGERAEKKPERHGKRFPLGGLTFPARALLFLSILLGINLLFSWLLWDVRCRPLVYYEYFAASLLGLWVCQRGVLFLIFGLVLAGDVLFSAAGFYQHDGITFALKCPQLFRSAFGWGFWAGLVGFVGLVGASAWGLAALQTWVRAGTSRRACGAAIFLVAGGLFLADLANGSVLSVGVGKRHRELNVAGSLVLMLRESFREWSAGRQALAMVKPYRSEGRHTSPSLEHLTAGAGRQLVIVLESWGLAQGEEFRALATKCFYRKLVGKYDIQEGSCHCAGGTAGAEARELLGREPAAYYSAIHRGTAGCETLVSRMKHAGKKTVAIFPFSGHFGQALAFRKQLGFDNILSRNEMQADSSGHRLPVNRENHYGSLDDEVAVHAGMQALAQGGPVFVYVVTINTHLPFQLARETKESAAYQSFARQWRMRFPSEACFEHFYRLQTLLDFIATELEPGLADEVVVVGDHPPPFISHEDRAFYAATSVPYVVLKKH